MTAEKILEIARKEIGVKESPANSNRVKYNTAYYGKEVSGSKYAWCCAFVWWCFRQAGASELFYGGGKTAYCPTLKNYHKAQAVKGSYKPGDVIFFNFKGGSNAAHVGICESWDGSYITTIDGNTGSGNQANGGAVMRQKRAKKYIVGAYRPSYKEKEVIPDMTEEQVKKIAQTVVSQIMEADSYRLFAANMDRYRKELWTLPGVASGTMAEEMQRAVAAGITDGSGPQALPTRQEVVSMVVRAQKI